MEILLVIIVGLPILALIHYIFFVRRGIPFYHVS